MNGDIYITILLAVWSFIILVLIRQLILLPILRYKENIKNKELKIEESKLYSNIDINEVNALLDKYFDDRAKSYILNNFIKNKISYVNAEQKRAMVRDLTKSTILDISELYIYYIKLLHNLNTDDDLTSFIYVMISKYTEENVAALNSIPSPDR